MEVGRLITEACGARERATRAESRAIAAEQAVVEWLAGREVVITGQAWCRLQDGCRLADPRQFVRQPATVKFVAYYYHESSRCYVDILRVKLPNDEYWELPLTRTEVALAE